MARIVKAYVGQLRSCSYAVAPGQSQPIRLDEAVKSRLVGVQETWAGQGQRVLLLARKTVPRSEIPKEMLESEQLPDYINTQINMDLTIVGLVGLVDPPKADIPETVAILRGAGIRVCMVTGDFALSKPADADFPPMHWLTVYFTIP